MPFSQQIIFYLEVFLQLFGKGSPITAWATVSSPNSRQISSLYMVLPHLYLNVYYHDAGLSVVTYPKTTFVQDLPCLSVEVPRQCPNTNTLIQVRASDGTHFCPKVGKDGLTCEVHCSGCYRFGTNMARSALKYALSKTL